MTRQAIIERTVQAIKLLPPVKAEEISDFADFVSKRYEEQTLLKGIRQLQTKANCLTFFIQRKTFIHWLT